MKIKVDKKVVEFLLKALWEEKEGMKGLSKYYETQCYEEAGKVASLEAVNESLRSALSSTLDDNKVLGERYDRIYSEVIDLRAELDYTAAILGEE